MDKKWLLKRLMAMSLGEVSYRFRKMVRFKLLRKVFQQGKLPAGHKIKLRIPVDFSPVDFRHWDRAEFDSYIQDLIDNRIKFFGTEFDLSSGNDWLTDPVTGIKWNLDYFNNVDYRRPDSPGDPKVIWEINRHQHLILLGIAFRKNGDEVLAHKVVDSILAWIDNNPLFMGINWVSPLELAVRIISWTFSLSLIADSKALTETARDRIAELVFHQAEFIYNNLSLYSSSNNHLAGELTGLIFGSYLITGSGREDKWRRKAVPFLEEQVSNQFYPDGVNKEQTISYQCFTLEFYLLSLYMLKRNGSVFDGRVLHSLSSACAFLMDISDSSGRYPNLGDEDDGYALIADVTANKVLSVLNMGSILLEKNCMQEKLRLIDSKCVLLFGNQYTETVAKMPAFNSAQEAMKIYPEGGYAIFRGLLSNGGETIATFDFGPIGMGSLSAHGHADLLSIHVLYNNTPFIIDPGTYKYFFSEGFRDYFKGTAAHNTVSVDYNNQLENSGMFLWGKHPHVRFHSGKEDDTVYAEAEHDGYLEEFGVRHRRRVEWKESALYLYDTIESSRKNSIQQFFHLHPDVVVEEKGSNLFRLISDQKCIYIQMDPRLTSGLRKGQEAPYKLGWYSSSFYDLKETNVFENKAWSQGDECFVTKIYFGSIVV